MKNENGESTTTTLHGEPRRFTNPDNRIGCCAVCRYHAHQLRDEGPSLRSIELRDKSQRAAENDELCGYARRRWPYLVDGEESGETGEVEA